MSYLGDTLTVGLILVLVFGSIALYLYTRIQQTEQKVSLLESIVLDLKLTGELPIFGEFPLADTKAAASAVAEAKGAAISSLSLSPSALVPSSPLAPILTPIEEQPEYIPFEDEVEAVHELEGTQEEHLPLEEAIAIHPFPEESPYDNMTLKELQGIVRARGLPSEKGAKKQTLIDALKGHDLKVNEVKPAPAPSSTFLESSSPVSEDV